MSVEYYHLAPVILDDDLYIRYGGRTGTSTIAQRLAAYQIAEAQMIRELNTFLLPTTVTGTWQYSPYLPPRLELPYHHMISVDAVTFLSQESLCSCDIAEDAGCAFIADSTFGYVDVRRLTSTYLGCGCTLEIPYQVRIAFTAGLPTGTAANDAALQLALTMVAELNLLEVIDPAALEGGPGDPGIREYVSMGYGEKRMPMAATVFGSSARANKAKQLVQHLTPKVALKLGH